MKRNFSQQRIDGLLMANPESFAYKTRAFITGGRLHFLFFTVNNKPTLTRIGLLGLIYEHKKKDIEPFKVFEQGRKLLTVFLETNSSTLNFQVMEQSKNSSREASMEATILRCFRDLIAIIYQIGQTKTVIVYQLYQEEYGEVQTTFEERNFVPDYQGVDLEQRGRRRTRFRLRQIEEVQDWVVGASTLHDVFFLSRDALCLMIDSDLVLWRIRGLDRDNLQTGDPRSTPEYLRVKIKRFEDRRVNVRKFQLDRAKKRLYYVHGRILKKYYLLKVDYSQKMMAAGSIDLSKLYEFLEEPNLEKVARDDVEALVAPTIGLTETLLKRERPSGMPSSFSDLGQ